MEFTDRVMNLTLEGAYHMLARAQAMEAQGREITHLEIGQPDVPTFSHISEAALQAIYDGHTGYTPGGEDNQWPAMKKYPHYFDADQLYDLSKDPDEQHNLAYDPAYKEILKAMKAELKKYLDKLPGNYAEFKQSEPAPKVSQEEKAAIAEKLRKSIHH